MLDKDSIVVAVIGHDQPGDRYSHRHYDQIGLQRRRNDPVYLAPSVCQYFLS